MVVRAGAILMKAMTGLAVAVALVTIEYVHEENGSLKRVIDTEGHLLAQVRPLKGE